jgi:hypothetical protein
VSFEAVRTFKLVTLREVDLAGAEMNRLLGPDERQVLDLISTATGMAGALWQMASPGPRPARLDRVPAGARAPMPAALGRTRPMGCWGRRRSPAAGPR